jgi:hypothetical protein
LLFDLVADAGLAEILVTILEDAVMKTNHILIDEVFSLTC